MGGVYITRGSKMLYYVVILRPEVPKYYTWNKSSKMFFKKKQGELVSLPGYNGRASDALRRVYTVHSSNAECFYLRLGLLLHTVRGPTSFADLKTADGEECETFREACQRRGLLEDDQHWDLTSVSYTHLDVYKRQVVDNIILTILPNIILPCTDR